MIMQLKSVFLVITMLAGCAAAAAFPKADKLAEDLVKQSCDALLARQHKGPPGDPMNGAIQCPCTNPIAHRHHTRAAEAMLPLAWLYSRGGNRQYLDGAFALARWLISRQAPNGHWLETPHSWWGTTAHQCFCLAAAHTLLASQLKLNPMLNDQWVNALKKANDFLLLKVQPGRVPLDCLPTTACALHLSGGIVQSKTALERANELIQETLSHVNADQMFVQGPDKICHVGSDLCQTLPMLALYATLTQNKTLEKQVRYLVDHYLMFLWPNGTVDASWGGSIQDWTLWGVFGKYGLVPALALLNAKAPVFREAALKNMLLIRDCFHPAADGGPALLGYGPEPLPGNDREAACIYPTFANAVGLVIALHWGDLSQPQPDTPLLHASPMIRKIPSCSIIHVNNGAVMATLSWRSKTLPAVYPPMGGALTHLHLAGIGTVQCASPTLFVNPERLQRPLQKGMMTLTPRVECIDNNVWYTNLFDREAVFNDSRNHPPKYSFKGTLRDMAGLASDVRYEMTYRFDANMIQKTLYITGRGANQAIVAVEPIVMGSTGWKMDATVNNQVTFETPRGSFKIVLDDEFDGVLLEAPEKDKPDAAYHPILPSVRMVPIKIRFVADRANKARWKILKIP